MLQIRLHLLGLSRKCNLSDLRGMMDGFPVGSQLLEAAGEGGKIIMACEAGGSLIPNASFSHGKESRSLKVGGSALPLSSADIEGGCAVQSPRAPPRLSVTLVQKSRTSAFLAKLYAVQAAWKAVVAKKYSDIKHLSGGVYGEQYLSVLYLNAL